MQGYEGKVAISRGPLVYCLESVDNPEIDVLTARVDAAALQPEWEPELLGGTIEAEKGWRKRGRVLVYWPRKKARLIVVIWWVVDEAV